MSMDRVEVLRALGEALDSQWDSQGTESPADESLPASPEARRRLSRGYLRLAKDLLKLDAGDESLAACRKAVLADPDNLDASYFLLSRLEKLNRVDEAWAALLAIERRHPTFATAGGDLLYWKACLEYRRGHLETARHMFEDFIEKNGGRPVCTGAHGWLGKVLDRLGLYDGAMEAIARYNNLAAAHPRGREMLEKSKGALADVETSVRWYRDKTSFEWQATSNVETDASPIVLVGFPRSGTTLLGQILGSHSMVRTLEEQPTLEGIEERFYGSDERLSNLEELSPDDALACRQAYWANVERFGAGAPGGHARVVDKHPLNIVHLDIYARLFPGIRIIVALRDPRDCVLSNYFQMYDLNPAMAAHLSLETSARYYARVMELYLLFRACIPDNLHEVRYEDIVGDFRNECSRLLGFLGLEWEDGLVRFHETASHRWIRTPSYDQVTRPLYDDAVGRWRSYAHHLEEVTPLLQPFVETFGYRRKAGG